MDIDRLARRRSTPSLFAVLLAAGAIASASAQEAAKAPAPTADATSPGPVRTALIDDGAAPDLFLLYTGDVIGYLDPCG